MHKLHSFFSSFDAFLLFFFLPEPVSWGVCWNCGYGYNCEGKGWKENGEVLNEVGVSGANERTEID